MELARLSKPLRCRLCGNEKGICSMEGLSEQRATTPFHYYFKSQWRGGRNCCKCEEILGFFFLFFSNSVCQKRIKTKPVCGSVQNVTGNTHWLTLEAFHVDFLHLPKNYGCFSCIFPHIKRNKSSWVAFTAPIEWAQTVKVPSMQAYWWALVHYLPSSKHL